MIYTLKNDALTVEISDRGAEVRSIRDGQGRERLWQGDAAYWEERAPILFPFCGRQWEGRYVAKGRSYDMGIHGFFRLRETTVERADEQELVLVQTDGEDTRSIYPYAFSVRITYRLEGSCLSVRAEITNRGEETMFYGYGGHPGFRVPFGGGSLSDYHVAFPKGEAVRAACFDASQTYPAGGTRPFSLSEGRRFVLDDEIFARESVFLCDTGDEAVLASDGAEGYVRITYEGFDWLGLWKCPGAEYLCMEPWIGMPADSGRVTVLEEKADLVRLEAGEKRTHAYAIEIG